MYIILMGQIYNTHQSKRLYNF